MHDILLPPFFSDGKMAIQGSERTHSGHTASECDLGFKFKSAAWSSPRETVRALRTTLEFIVTYSPIFGVAEILIPI